MAKSYTQNYNLVKPGVDDFYNVQDQNNNMDILDAALKPTADPAQVPSGNIGKLAQWVSWFANRIKAITGAANWYDAPAMTISALATALGLRPTMTTADITYYVATTGNDSNDGLTSGTAFKTIQKAIDSIPQIVNHTVTINVAAGTYAESVSIQGFSGKGIINVVGDSAVSTSRSLTACTIARGTAYVLLKGFNITTTTGAGVSVAGVPRVDIQYMNIVAAAASQAGIYVNGSGATIQNCAVSNKNYAIQAVHGSAVTVIDCTGTGNVVGLTASQTSIIGKSGTQPGGTTAEYKTSGSMIVDATGVLPLIGGSMTGQINMTNANQIRYYPLTSFSTTRFGFIMCENGNFHFADYVDANKQTSIFVNAENVLASKINIADKVAGVTTVYPMYHTGNITVSTSAPSTTLAEGAQHQVY
ncbi:MAG: hypothetical protein K0R55_2094 [Sporomusa sp.]|jgi:hypothetical protein|nr:hypothetical protein [Sporomusa sp.]